MDLEWAEVVAHRQIASQEFILTLFAPKIVASAQAGQFVSLQISQQIQPLLRRPISIHDVEEDKGLLILYYHVVGVGTDLLSQYQVGEKLSVLGPLGHGFDLDITDSKVCLIGGGIGQAPLRMAARQLKEKNNQVMLIMGARNQDGLQALDYYHREQLELYLATEDGSLGTKGFVTEHMNDLAQLGVKRIYACGPKPMLRAVKATALAQNIPCQVSLEEKMACGVGVCLGCTCKSSDENTPYPKVCTHGPVFWAQEVNLDD